MIVMDMVAYALIVIVTMILAGSIIFAFVMVKKVKARKANTALCKLLAAQAHYRLRDDHSLSHVEHRSEKAAIDSALEKEWAGQLAAYANIIGEVPAMDITFAVFAIEHEMITDKTAMTPDMLTAEQVTAYHKCKDAAELDDHNYSFLPSSEPSQIGYYAMVHVDDYPMILSIIEDRKIKSLDEIKKVLAEMKANPSSALSGGML